jgi:hypothetical protein
MRTKTKLLLAGLHRSIAERAYDRAAACFDRQDATGLTKAWEHVGRQWLDLGNWHATQASELDGSTLVLVHLASDLEVLGDDGEWHPC